MTHNHTGGIPTVRDSSQCPGCINIADSKDARMDKGSARRIARYVKALDETPYEHMECMLRPIYTGEILHRIRVAETGCAVIAL
jgi:hypothetical protein